jgi:hypothetical protein
VNGLRLLLTVLLGCSLALPAAAQEHSVARKWNDVLLDAIRDDFARPTVHARNLFHVAVAMYDAWAAYGDGTQQTYLLGQTVAGFTCGFDGVDPVRDLTTAQIAAAREEAISYAAYRLLRFRFANSPGWETTFPRTDSLFAALGYDRSFVARSDPGSSPARLGNYLAQCLIEFGVQDGSNEAIGYHSTFYEPVNAPLNPALIDPPELADPNRWQPLKLETFIDQGGNLLGEATPGFLGPEWGQVVPFALDPAGRRVYRRDDNPYVVYHDPGAPPHIDTFDYKWNFALVAVWSGHLSPADGVMIDISPASIGNIPVDELPRDMADYSDFYNLIDGGDAGTGRRINPHTGGPYEPQIVPRGDYARVLAEFWADGPASETPPGHWFTILNYVSDHLLFERRYMGTGAVLTQLAWDVRAYLTLGGAMHDAAVAAWGIKGWYDYVRPISALRYMASLGQSGDPDELSYHPDGIPLIPGHIELVKPADPLAGFTGANIGKIKLNAWRGPPHVSAPREDEAGVGWMLAESWWPYQSPNFVTPPFAGYVSGHSTFSRAGAEVMTLLTGDEYFPGGLGEFLALKNEFLLFEDGPSVDITLQWATYRDASDQCSLSRIWGGIHPPVDDIPGRLIGRQIGIDAFARADRLFRPDEPTVVTEVGGEANATFVAGQAAMSAWPNPVQRGDELRVVIGGAVDGEEEVEVGLYNVLGQQVGRHRLRGDRVLQFDTSGLASGLYLLQLRNGRDLPRSTRVMIVE